MNDVFKTTKVFKFYPRDAKSEISSNAIYTEDEMEAAGALARGWPVEMVTGTFRPCELWLRVVQPETKVVEDAKNVKFKFEPRSTSLFLEDEDEGDV